MLRRMIFWYTADIKPPTNWIIFDLFILTTLLCKVWDVKKQTTAARTYHSGNPAPGCTHGFWVLGCVQGGARRLLPHIPRGSPHPSPPWSTARDTEPWVRQSLVNEDKQTPGQHGCLRTVVFLEPQGCQPGKWPAGGNRTLTGFERLHQADVQGFASLYGSDQITTNLKQMLQLVVVPLVCTICHNSNCILKRGAFYCL